VPPDWSVGGLQRIASVLALAAVRPARLRALLDEQAIRNVLMTYCRGVDRCDSDLLRSVYHLDSVDNHSIYYNSSGSDFADYLLESVARHGHEVLAHHLTNTRIHVTGRRAASESYFIAFHQVRGEIHVLSGRYLDRLESRRGRWRIVSRVVVHDLDFAADHRLAFAAGHFPAEGMMNRSDPSYAYVPRRGTEQADSP
jgi:SnoaL-like domain